MSTDTTIPNHDVFALAIEGSRLALDLAEKMVREAMARFGEDREVEYPETCYELPAIFAWDGRETGTLGKLLPIISSYREKVSGTVDIASALAAGRPP